MTTKFGLKNVAHWCDGQTDRTAFSNSTSNILRAAVKIETNLKLYLQNKKMSLCVKYDRRTI